MKPPSGFLPTYGGCRTSHGGRVPVDPMESAEVILWRQADCRCELWQINGIGALRVYRGEDLVHQELSQTGQIVAQSNKLRRFAV